MSKDSKRKLLMAVATLVALLSIIYIYLFDPFIESVRYTPTGLSDFRDIGYYAMNPQTILASLDRGEMDSFTPEVTTPDTPLFDQSFSWHQSDYMKIADAVHQLVWKQTLDDWNLYYMNFSVACQDNLNGFSLGDFYYFKTVFLNNGKIRYTARELQITPQYGDVTWGGNANFPRSLFGWKSINLNRIEIAAEEALNIADENGGKEARSSVQNNCTIQVRLSGYDPGWIVRIRDNTTSSEIFRMIVDPYTGEVK